MRVKICGITNLGDALCAADLGASALGFVFYPKSPRYIAPQAAGEIIALLPPELTTVGVFVDASAAEVASARAESGVTLVQLHGAESPSLCAEIGQGQGVIKALRPRTLEDLSQAAAYTTVAAFLVDAAVEGQYGGTGRLANWDLARALKDHGLVWLSGGLTAANVEGAIRSVAPHGVDVSSGVEREAGIKDRDKLGAFFDAVRAASIY